MKQFYLMDYKELGMQFAQNVADSDDLSKSIKERFYQQWEMYKHFGVFDLLKINDSTIDKDSIYNLIQFMYGLGLGSTAMGICFPINVQIWACIAPIVKYKKNIYLKNIQTELLSGKLIGAHAISETEAGSDVFNLETVYEETKDGYLLNGRKNYVTNAPYADVYLVYARKKGSLNFKSISCFIIKKENEGFSVSKEIKKMGMELSPMASIYLNNCLVSQECLLGKENQGMPIFNYTMMHERTFLLAFQVGIMESQLDRTLNFCKRRQQSGKAIIEFQSVSNRIADMKVNLEACKLFLNHIVKCLQEDKDTFLDSSIAKLFISERLVENSVLSMKNYGTFGYTQECYIEEQIRDSFGSLFYSGTSDIQRNIISSLM